MQKKIKKKLSVISSLHFVRLAVRGIFFVWSVIVLFLDKTAWGAPLTEKIRQYNPIFIVMWVMFAFEMISRQFPSKTESMGCQKVFKKNFIPTEIKKPDLKAQNRGVLIAGASWILLNAAIAVLYFLGIISQWVLLIVSLFYSISDMICILFFCPFQTLMMKNRCCTTCRIYNWDFLMMFTPFLFIPSVYTYSLAALAIALFVRWEITAAIHPERFSEESNAAMKCENCREKLCGHKKQLAYFWGKEREKTLALLEREKSKRRLSSPTKNKEKTK